jgi:hypothetical protein
MAKRQPPIVYTGSLKRNFWFYLMKWHFAVNLKDHYFAKWFVYMEREFREKRIKCLNPDFAYTYEQLDGRENHSYIKVTWMTGMEKKFYVHRSRDDIKNIFFTIKLYNYICEEERNEQGHDDEPDDEVSLL